jgi:hypothetical protein
MTWGNGVSELSGIHKLIRDDSNFEIIRIKRFDIRPEKMGQFIESVYSCDTVPIEHLRSKTRYLLNCPPVVFFTLVRNIEPDEQYFGEGNFRHIQCTKVKLLKEKIRNLYNPRHSDKNFRIPPLDFGVTHEHCIHASDYESQVEYMLKFLDLKDIKYYDTVPKGTPWHIQLKNKNSKIVEKDIDDLVINIVDEGICKITETPHYEYLLGNREKYLEYIQRNIGITLQEDHFPEKFDNLIRDFSADYSQKNKSYVIIDRNRVSDGAHRVCIMKHMGIKKVMCYDNS